MHTQLFTDDIWDRMNLNWSNGCCDWPNKLLYVWKDQLLYEFAREIWILNEFYQRDHYS